MELCIVVSVMSIQNHVVRCVKFEIIKTTYKVIVYVLPHLKSKFLLGSAPKHPGRLDGERVFLQ